MITRKHRFHGHGSLRYVYQHGDVVRGPLCSLRYCTNQKRKQYRLAVVVSKKVSKSAVTRNRIRRRVFEIIRNTEPKITSPHDIIFTAFSDQLATLPHQEINKVIIAQLKQAGVLS